MPQIITAAATLGGVLLTLWITGKREGRREAARIEDESNARLLPRRLDLYDEFLNAARSHAKVIRDSLLPRVDRNEWLEDEISAWTPIEKMTYRLELVAPRLKVYLSQQRDLRYSWENFADTEPTEAEKAIFTDDYDNCVDTIAWEMSRSLGAVGDSHEYLLSQGYDVQRPNLLSRLTERKRT